MFIQGAQSPISVQKSAVKTPDIIEKVDTMVAENPELAPYRNTTALGYEFARLILENNNGTDATATTIPVQRCEVDGASSHGMKYRTQ